MDSLSTIQMILLVLMATLGASAANAKQDCDGFETRIGEREVRCIKPGSGVAFKSSKNGGRRMNVLAACHAKLVPVGASSAFHSGVPSSMSV